MIDVILGVLFIAWPYLWIYLFFVEGYARIRYPGGENGVNPCDAAQVAKARAKGWNWVIVAILAIVLWVIVPPLIFGF